MTDIDYLIENAKFTIQIREYLKKFNLENKEIDKYIKGLNDDYTFWDNIYTDKKIEENLLGKKKIRIGEKYQINKLS